MNIKVGDLVVPKWGIGKIVEIKDGKIKVELQKVNGAEGDYIYQTHSLEGLEKHLKKVTVVNE